MAGGIRENHGDDLVENHEINVTPFIDVMLVLLIIFMVAAPLATVDINVDLPVSNATPSERPEQPVFVTVKPDLTLSIGNETLPLDSLGTALRQATNDDKGQRIFLRADKQVAYGDLMTVMNSMRDNGYLSIALVGLETGAAAPATETAGAAAPTNEAPAE
ncbi:TonB system transport protein ExbD [Paracoccus fistulariae]|uniref:Biopolymer transport protein ExbD n=1 Tax=Paracoccus fistulariae TaxID=658446 RepID=A0ABY7SIZ7_9RHOB|nr:TonB system transport protein ExbD [Paracoccus fistulariae]MDB6181242.1 TonB system transport protein ExbD [Paracoccus fistulariae]WCR06522.1 TonB system transport protein ExbD [Paracoccus fistulariae]